VFQIMQYVTRNARRKVLELYTIFTNTNDKYEQPLLIMVDYVKIRAYRGFI